MFPINLNVAELSVLLVGNGKQTARRLRLLDEANAQHVRIFSDDVSKDLHEAAGSRLIERLPTEDEIKHAAVLMVTEATEADGERLALLARKVGTLVNVEDVKPLCDFYFSSQVRRGDLIIAVSTSGQSPTVARRIKEAIAHCYPDVWESRLKELGEMRERWYADDITPKEIMARTDALLTEWIGAGECQALGCK